MRSLGIKILFETRQKNKYRNELEIIRNEIARLKKWKSSLGVRYTYHANKYWRVEE